MTYMTDTDRYAAVRYQLETMTAQEQAIINKLAFQLQKNIKRTNPRVMFSMEMALITIFMIGRKAHEYGWKWGKHA